MSVATLATVVPYMFSFVVGKYKLKRLNWVLGFSFALLILSFLKGAYNAPRPWFIDPDIRPISAEFGCGFPSGHVLTATYIFTSIFEEFFFKRRLYIATFWAIPKKGERNGGQNSPNRGQALNQSLNENEEGSNGDLKENLEA